jgi:peptide methionine sulfoxide reductase MsrA
MQIQNKFSLIVIFLIFILVSNGCAKKVIFQNSAVVPAARGYIQVKTDKNKNYTISVQITDLAEAARLTPPKATYLVWMVTDQNINKNIGQLKSSKTGLYKILKADFKTVSAFKPIKIFVTAEDEHNVTYPSDQIIMTTDIF